MKKFSFISTYLGFMVLIAMIFAYSLLTNNTYDLFFKPRYYLAYESMWQHLVRGSVELDGSAIQGERYLFNGKVLTYYLPFPALIRGILTLFGYGSSAVLSVMLAVATYIASSALLFHDIIKIFGYKLKKFGSNTSYLWLYYPILVFPIVGLCFEASIAWESLIWGLSIFLITLHFFYLAIEDLKNRYSLLFILFSSLSLFTRPTFILATIFLVGFFVCYRLIFFKRNLRIVLISTLFAISLLILGGYNFLKFENPFTFAPMEYHEQLIGNERGEKVKKLPNLSLKRLPYAIEYYWLPNQSSFKSHQYGFISAKDVNSIIDFKMFDYVELKIPITLSIPILCLFSLMGLISLSIPQSVNPSFKDSLSKASFFIGATIPSFLMLLVHSMAIRYKVDAYPALILLTSSGIASYAPISNFKMAFVFSMLLTLITILFIGQTIVIERMIFYHDCSAVTPEGLCAFYSFIGDLLK